MKCRNIKIKKKNTKIKLAENKNFEKKYYWMAFSMIKTFLATVFRTKQQCHTSILDNFIFFHFSWVTDQNHLELEKQTNFSKSLRKSKLQFPIIVTETNEMSAVFSTSIAPFSVKTIQSS